MHRAGVTLAISIALVLAFTVPALGGGLSASTQAAGNVSSSGANLKAQLTPLSLSTSYYFDFGTTTSYGTQTPVTYVTSTASAQTVKASVSGLKPSTTYHYRVVAGEGSTTVTGSDMTFKTLSSQDGNSNGQGANTNTQGSDTSGQDGGSGGSDTTSGGEDGDAGGDRSGPASTGGFPAAFPTSVGVTPVLGSTVAAAPAAGGITVRLAGSKMFVPLQSAAALPVGSLVDTRAGTVNLVTAVGTAAATQAAQFHGAVFRIGQTRSGRGMTDIYLHGGNFRSCPAKRARRVSAARARTVRRLWGRDRGGRFRTHGTRAVATVRGTTWSVADRCDGTLTKVAAGAVSVYDRRTHHKVLVKAGHSYLARKR